MSERIGANSSSTDRLGIGVTSRWLALRSRYWLAFTFTHGRPKPEGSLPPRYRVPGRTDETNRAVNDVDSNGVAVRSSPRRHCLRLLNFTQQRQRTQLRQSAASAEPHLQPVDSTTRPGRLGPILSQIESTNARTAPPMGPKCAVLTKSCDKIEPVAASGFTTRMARNPARPRMQERWQEHRARCFELLMSLHLVSGGLSSRHSGPGGSDCHLLPKLVSGIVYQERNSRAVHGEFDAGDRGRADDVGMIPVEESYREHRTGGKTPKKRDTRQRMSLPGASTPG